MRLAVLAEGLVDVMETHGAVLGGIPESSLSILEKLVYGVRVPEQGSEGQEVGTCTVEQLRVLDIGVAACDEVIDDDVAGSAQMADEERVRGLEDRGSRDTELSCDGVDAGVDFDELQAVGDGLKGEAVRRGIAVEVLGPVFQRSVTIRAVGPVDELLEGVHGWKVCLPAGDSQELLVEDSEKGAIIATVVNFDAEGT